MVIEDFEEIIPRELNTQKEKQLGVPFNVSWGGGTQGLRESLMFSACTDTKGKYIQDPESMPNQTLSGTSLSGLTTDILLEPNFGGTFMGGLSQFRMYTEPLSTPQVQHNYRELKGRYNLYDFWCSNCFPCLLGCYFDFDTEEAVCDFDFVTDEITCDFGFNISETECDPNFDIIKPTPGSITPTPTPTNLTPTPTPTVSPTSVTPTPTPTVSPTSVTPTPTPTVSPTSVTPTPTPSITPSPNYSLSCNLNCVSSDFNNDPIGLFTFDSVGENLSEFSYNSATLKSIYDNNYDSFEMAIPSWNGTMEIMTLEKTQYSNSEITLSSQNEVTLEDILTGVYGNQEKVKPLLRTYRIKDGNKSIGSLGISETTVYCLYEKNGTTVLLTESSDRLYTAFKAFIDGPNFNCGNTVNPKEREINQFRESVMSQSLSGSQYYCVDMIYDLPFNSYNRIQQNGGNSQLYIESMNLFLNAFYEPSFNGDFTFKVKGIVEWTNPATEPWNIAGNPGYTQYRDTIGTYYKNNHNLILPGVDYNFVYQINRSSFNNTGLQGISNFLGIYYPDINNTINNVAVAYNVNVDLPYVMSGVTGNLFDNFLHAHEIGHAVLGFHTWNFGTYSVPLGPFSWYIYP